MTDGSWTQRIAAERMQTDQEFADRVAASPLSSQQWGLVMTAVEFEIDGPEDPETAELVVDAQKLTSVMDEIRRIGDRQPGGAATADNSGGLLDSVKDVFGGSEADDQLRETAEDLAAEYATALQTRLEERGRWAEVCELARS
ncbi:MULTISPECIES: DUF5799 family protein [unclassified Halorhabdus]|uniref:DUF5799 family protein n=1 Tax=unclassified Halorhabdus TaxID=2621901 RepID=UPI0023DA3295|nr:MULTISPECIES: DUF5799 family protein [unclassified Halorhabdus]WEL17444.1 Uncharacterized protein SVXHr_1273 [Halorhabdus sp. SVX81]